MGPVVCGSAKTWAFLSRHAASLLLHGPSSSRVGSKKGQGVTWSAGSHCTLGCDTTRRLEGLREPSDVDRSWTRRSPFFYSTAPENVVEPSDCIVYDIAALGELASAARTLKFTLSAIDCGTVLE